MVELRSDSGAIIERFQIDKDSIKHGEYLAFYEDGTTKEVAYYESGKLNGDRKIFYDNGQEEIVERYEKDIMVGPYKVYHKNGTLKLVVNFYDGVMEGPMKVYYSDGTLKEEVTMKNNNENGPFKEFHPNGQVHWEGYYLNGDNEFGELREYNEEGELIKKMECDSMAVCKTVWSIEQDGSQ